MTSLKLSAIAFVTLLASSCTLGSDLTSETQSGDVLYLDTDGDGAFDAIDVDGDGVADYYFDLDNCESCDGDLDPIAFCANPFVDSNNDGVVDGLDFDCDGIIDVPLNTGGGGGGGGGTSRCRTQINQKEISCEKSNGGPYSCECKVNGSLVKTCTTTSNSACSQPGNGNCCGF